MLENNEKVDALFAEWQAKNINMVLSPIVVPNDMAAGRRR